MPAGAQVSRQLLQLVYRTAFAGRAGLAQDDVEHVKFALDPGRVRAARRSSTPLPGSPLTATMMRAWSSPTGPEAAAAGDAGAVHHPTRPQPIAASASCKAMELVRAEEVSEGLERPCPSGRCCRGASGGAAAPVRSRSARPGRALRTTQSGTRSPYLHPGHVLDLVGDALEMLDVDGGDDVDSGG